MAKQIDEAERIYRALFNGPLPPGLGDRFRGASQRLEAGCDAEEIAVYHRCLERVGDLEALEWVARLRGKLPLLRDKFKIMVYLAETRPDHYERFINEKDRVLWTYLVVGLALPRAFWKLLKGLVLLRRCGP